MKQFIIFILTAVFCLQAQPTEIMNAAEIKLGIKKLGVLGSVLYLAAHPDDENTAILAYYDKGRGYRAAYLALTRGRGGQNLIGPEKGALMSVLRTSELQQARKIDGAEQFFTRAIDFGYSKNPEETFEFWNRDSVLKDIVTVIRTFKPDIIIDRFPVSGGGHGHHTASAILSVEAFKKAADVKYLPGIPVWQPKRLLWNTWRPRGSRSPNDASAENLLTVDTGEYNPLLGKSYTEIAALSRSQHKSQGFGVRAYRGANQDYLQVIAGEEAVNDAFDGIDTSWKRVKGAASLSGLIESVDHAFDPEQPQASVPGLLKIYNRLSELQPSYWVVQKTDEIKQLIQSCAGLWLEAIASDYGITPGSTLPVSIAMLNRSNVPISAKKITFSLSNGDSALSLNLAYNRTSEVMMQLPIPENTPFSNPCWLETAPVTKKIDVRITLSIADTPITFKVPVLYRWSDRVLGERYRPLQIIPPVMINFTQPVYIFNGMRNQRIDVQLRSGKENISGELALTLPPDWQCQPHSVNFAFIDKYEEQTVSFNLSSDREEATGTLKARATIDGAVYNRGYYEFNYEHIPKISVFPESEAHLVKVKISKKGESIGYITGSGDDIPAVLEQLGYRVSLIDETMVDNIDLSQFDAVVTGVRAYNTNTRLVANYEKMMQYVKAGGTLVVQYNTSGGLLTNQIGPYPFSIGRGRVTHEEAPVTFIDPEHPLLNVPNKIDADDFLGWIQERGLYFASSWDNKYQTVISCHDPGESALEGGLLYTRYGKGIFIYSSYVWFRELPAGIPGAIRFFVNLISARQNN